MRALSYIFAVVWFLTGPLWTGSEDRELRESGHTFTSCGYPVPASAAGEGPPIGPVNDSDWAQ